MKKAKCIKVNVLVDVLTTSEPCTSENRHFYCISVISDESFYGILYVHARDSFYYSYETISQLDFNCTPELGKWYIEERFGSKYQFTPDEGTHDWVSSAINAMV